MKNDTFKSGFVSIIGRPNVGKSTLLNALVGEKIAIISDKPQTTRNKILAIRNTEDAQIIFTDTPGIHKPKNKLGEYMVKVANESVGEMDAVLFVVDATNKTTEPGAQNCAKFKLAARAGGSCHQQGRPCAQGIAFAYDCGLQQPA